MSAPLAERVRPRTLDEVIGQADAIGTRSVIGRAWTTGAPVSLILWGPPGCGKTTVARLLTELIPHARASLSAVLDGVKQLREVLEGATRLHAESGRSTVLFVDEIHRWNKAQQDALLPHVESGVLVLIGATTESPTAELNPALRSRLRLVRLRALTDDDIIDVLTRALTHADGLAAGNRITDTGLARLASRSGGDARRALGELEAAITMAADDEPLDAPAIDRLLGGRDVLHDQGGNWHYDVLSALIKSMRGSDPDAAVYWLARLLSGGEDPVGVARRLVIFASEDVGNADPQAVMLAVACAQSCQLTGMPEARIALGQAVTYLATCPKSNAAYLAINAAIAEVEQRGALPVPRHISGAAVGYKYPHDHEHRFVRQQYAPDALVGRRFYEPTTFGHEKAITERLAWWRKRSGS